MHKNNVKILQIGENVFFIFAEMSYVRWKTIVIFDKSI